MRSKLFFSQDRIHEVEFFGSFHEIEIPNNYSISWSRHFSWDQNSKIALLVTLGVSICLDVVLIETLDLDVVKEWVSTVEKISTASKSKSWRSRYLNFVSTSMSRPKNLDQDREFCQDLKILAFLDSLSRSRSRSAWIFVFSRQDFSIRWDFSSFSDSKGLDNVEISRQILTASWQISTASWQISKILMRLDNLDKNLDPSKSRLKNLDFKNLDWDKKKVDLDMKDNLNGFQKLVSTQWTFSILISIGLDCRDPQP